MTTSSAAYGAASVWFVLVVGATALPGGAALAQAPGVSRGDSAMSVAMAAARQVAQPGPAEIALEDQALLKLPAGFLFIPGKEAGQILAVMGNRSGAGLLGLIFSTGEDKSPWFVVASYAPSGYIRDDDAKVWNAGDMLDQIRSRTDEANKERAAQGMSAIDVQDWIERPRYDPAAHQLQWSIASTVRGTPASADGSINYNTYALGRDGYVTMSLVTARSTVDSQKAVAAQLLAGLQFNAGKRYADFDVATDKVATYGLAALVGGATATKPSPFAVIAAFAAKYAMVLALCAVALAAIGYYFWERRAKSPAPPADAA